MQFTGETPQPEPQTAEVTDGQKKVDAQKNHELQKNLDAARQKELVKDPSAVEGPAADAVRIAENDAVSMQHEVEKSLEKQKTVVGPGVDPEVTAAAEATTTLGVRGEKEETQTSEVPQVPFAMPGRFGTVARLVTMAAVGDTAPDAPAPEPEKKKLAEITKADFETVQQLLQDSMLQQAQELADDLPNGDKVKQELAKSFLAMHGYAVSGAEPELKEDGTTNIKRIEGFAVFAGFVGFALTGLRLFGEKLKGLDPKEQEAREAKANEIVQRLQTGFNDVSTDLVDKPFIERTEKGGMKLSLHFKSGEAMSEFDRRFFQPVTKDGKVVREERKGVTISKDFERVVQFEGADPKVVEFALSVLKGLHEEKKPPAPSEQMPSLPNQTLSQENQVKENPELQKMEQASRMGGRLLGLKYGAQEVKDVSTNNVAFKVPAKNGNAAVLFTFREGQWQWREEEDRAYVSLSRLYKVDTDAPQGVSNEQNLRRKELNAIAQELEALQSGDKQKIDALDKTVQTLGKIRGDGEKLLTLKYPGTVIENFRGETLFTIRPKNATTSVKFVFREGQWQWKGQDENAFVSLGQRYKTGEQASQEISNTQNLDREELNKIANELQKLS